MFAGLRGPIAKETFQTLLVSRALTRLGYAAQAIKEVDYPLAHLADLAPLAIASGEATFMVDHWDPLHADFYKGVGGVAKRARKPVRTGNPVTLLL